MHHRNFSFGAVIQANQNRKHDNNINGASINFSHVVVRNFKTLVLRDS